MIKLDDTIVNNIVKDVWNLFYEHIDFKEQSMIVKIKKHN